MTTTMTQTKTYVGYHEDAELPFGRGDTVVIPKGTTIFTTRPNPVVNGVRQPGRQTITAKKTLRVKIHCFMPGMNRVVDGVPQFSGPVQNPRVCWVGSGGYWHEVDINEVQRT